MSSRVKGKWFGQIYRDHGGHVTFRFRSRIMFYRLDRPKLQVSELSPKTWLPLSGTRHCHSVMRPTMNVTPIVNGINMDKHTKTYIMLNRRPV